MVTEGYSEFCAAGMVDFPHQRVQEEGQCFHLRVGVVKRFP